jgi:NADH dehydrogenase FAD-containing subunit
VARGVGLEVRGETSVHAVGADHVLVTGPDGSQRLASDLTIWATGAAAPDWFVGSGLPTDSRGFLRVDEHLTSPGDRGVFAAGDAAAVDWAPEVRKAGVYAVRMGPSLVQQLRYAIGGGRAPAPFRPQRRFLALLNTGDGRAIASWGPIALHGAWAMALKDRIDLAFMARFAALARPAPATLNGTRGESSP